MDNSKFSDIYDYEYRPTWILSFFLFFFGWPLYIPWILYENSMILLTIFFIRLNEIKYKKMVKDLDRKSYEIE